MRFIYGLLSLCFLIFFHELGHFLAARLFGVTVESFSIGFGPILFHRKKGCTDYRISLIPLGGYCGMKGEKDFVKSLEAGLDYIQAESDSLYGVHTIKRIAIAFAGPFFNLLFAFIGYTIIASIGYSYYSYSNRIKLVTETYPEIHSAAADAGLLSGDRIIQINGKKIENFRDIIEEIGTRPDENITVKVLRDDEEKNFSFRTDLDKSNGSGKIGVMSFDSEYAKYEAKRYSFFPALGQGALECAKTIKLTAKGIFTLFKGVDLKNSVSGPARIADMIGTVLKESFSDGLRTGIVNMFYFCGAISISLFIMNLLPVPILDGGLILFALIELIFRRKISPKVLYYIQFAGVAFIAVLFFIGLNGDINYFWNLIKGAK